jgi:hypothetical protein
MASALILDLPAELVDGREGPPAKAFPLLSLRFESQLKRWLAASAILSRIKSLTLPRSPARFVETRLADSVGPKARPVRKDTTGPREERGPCDP